MFRDRWAALAQVLIAASGAIAVLVSYRERWRDETVAEYYALLAAAGAGMLFFVQASNLMTLFLALEWFSIALYVLAAIDIDLIGSLEAGLKYLIVGSVGSATLLFGSALVYGETGSLSFDKIGAFGHGGDAMLVAGLAIIIVGLAFKASAAPFHMWTPDAYQGAPTPVTAFMASATKIAALVVTYRLLVTAFPQDERLWTVAIAVIAIVSLAWGNIAALVQRNVKRILAYSSISHAGFMLIAVAANNPLGARALMYYLIPYAAMSLGAFAVIAARERELGVPVTLDNLAGFGWERPFFGVSMWVFMLGFLGFPLTGGFVGKFYVFAAAYDRGWWWLIVAGVIATMISAYYYLGIVRAMYFRDAVELQLAPAGGVAAARAVAGRRRRHLRRRHGRLVLRGAAADRRRPLRRPTRCPSKASRGAARGARTARRRRPPSARRRPGRPSAPRRRAAARRRPRSRATGRRTRERRGTSASAQSRACSPPTESSRRSRYAPNATSAATAVNGTAASSASKARPCAPRASANAAASSEEGRESTTSHGHLASLSARTVLLCSRRSTIDERSSYGVTHLARSCLVPPRHGRRQAHLRRPVGQRADAARQARRSPSAPT